MNCPLLSVVVPVYKVEPYIAKCLDSICGQTYDKLEIILVDDGSPDNCGTICDEYAKKDNRITVIHKANGGLSSARNAGIMSASGEYITFVDSDDWIEPDMYSKLMSAVLSEDADLAACGTIVEQQDRQIKKANPAQTYYAEAILENLIKNNLGEFSAWNKVYRYEFVANTLFTEGRNFEDILSLYRIVSGMKKAVAISNCLYHYLVRNASISHDHSIKSLEDQWFAYHTQYSEIISDTRYSDDSEMNFLLLLGCASAISRTWRWAYSLRKTNREEIDHLTSSISSFVRTHYKVFGMKGYPHAYNTMLFLARFNNGFSKFLAYYANQFMRKLKRVDATLN